MIQFVQVFPSPILSPGRGVATTPKEGNYGVVTLIASQLEDT